MTAAPTIGNTQPWLINSFFVSVPPKFVVEPKDVSASVGTALRLRCEAEGRPEPRVKWLQEVRLGQDPYRDVDSLPGIRHVNGTLIFSHLSKEHGGAFVCQATNDVGGPITKRVQLTVNGNGTTLFPLKRISRVFLYHTRECGNSTV